ncbi:MAG: hypothetical protein U1F57_01360 [bacterium]
MRTRGWTVTLAVAMGVSLLISAASAEAKTKKRTYYGPSQAAPSGDVEYNATEKSPTLPLVQTPPPQNYPNSVSVGVPNYYYYYYPPVANYGYGGGYGGGYGSPGGYAAPSQVGASFYNMAPGRSPRGGMFFNTAIPGQVPPPGAYGGYGYGPGYGPGYYPPYNNGGTLFVP